MRSSLKFNEKKIEKMTAYSNSLSKTEKSDRQSERKIFVQNNSASCSIKEKNHGQSYKPRIHNMRKG
jgi:hypothetical protein